MNIKALITALAIVVGSSSAAMARPATVSVSGSVRGSISFGTGYSNYTTGYSQPDIRDHRTPVRPAPAPVRTTVRQNAWGPMYQWNREPVIMDRNLQFTTPGADGEMPYNDAPWIGVGTFGTGQLGTTALIRDYAPVYALHISATSGRPAFTNVLITYQDGSRQQVQVNSFVDRTGIWIPTKGAGIRQVQFESPSNTRGTFELAYTHGL